MTLFPAISALTRSSVAILSAVDDFPLLWWTELEMPITNMDSHLLVVDGCIYEKHCCTCRAWAVDTHVRRLPVAIGTP
jgi:hypothetical protein